jgi:hypothetical protein
MLSIFLLRLISSSPFILFDKKVEDNEGRVGEPLHVTFAILNLGDSLATNLHIDDAGIPLEQWEVPRSASDLRWSSLAPGSNVTHVFAVVPRIAGHLRQGSARLRYVAEGEKKIAMSSQLFWFESRSTRSIGAKANLSGYALVVGLAFGSVLLPFALWWTQKPAPAPVAKPKTT